MKHRRHDPGIDVREDKRAAYLPFVASALLLVVLAGSARAQAVYGSIAGSVTDENGEGIPRATVTVTSLERSTSDAVRANASGVYVKDRLLPGLYTVRVEAPGFGASCVTLRR